MSIPDRRSIPRISAAKRLRDVVGAGLRPTRRAGHLRVEGTAQVESGGPQSLRRAMPRALKHTQEFVPRADGCTVLVGHNPRDLVQMRQIMDCPGSNEL